MKLLAIGVFILMVLTIPFVFQTSPYLIHICVMAGLYAILALGLNFQLGSTNVVNFATAASYGIGAYTSALLAVHFHVPFWIGILIAGSVASLFGLVLGIPCMKTKDYYLSLVTIAFGLIIYILLINFSWTGGPNGVPNIPPPSILGHSFRDPINLFGFNLPFQSNFFYLVFVFVIGALFVAYRLHHSRVGLTWNAIREDEIAARCQGIDVTWYKILAFCIDAFFGGVTGTVYAHYIGFISPENFAFIVSVVVVTMVILGGMDNVFGVIIGAVLLTILPEKFRAFEDFRLLIYGVIVVTMLMFRPQGLFPQKLRVYRK
jgi:branched-chain amino acid transport system permease protein